MYKNHLPDLISDLKDIKSTNRDSSLQITKEKHSSKFCLQELLNRCNETNPKFVYTLDLRCEKLESIPIMKEFKQLKILDISSNCIKLLENLQHINTLKELKIFDNQLTNLLNLNNLKDLVVLQAQYNRITNIGNSVLSSCSKLQQIRLDNNKISQIALKDLTSCVNLTYVDVSFNNLRTISFMTCLPNLEEFHATNNSIEPIPDLSRCKKLTELRLSDNLILNISGIKNHKSLAVLDVSSNKITSMAGLGVLNKLEFLNLANNHVRPHEIQLLTTTFPNLEILNINRNSLTELDNVVNYLSNLHGLCELSMHDNPFPITNADTNERYHSTRITECIPDLKILDNTCLTKPVHQITNNHPLPMRPMTAAAGVSIRQVECQLINFSRTVADLNSANEKCFDDVMQSLLEDRNEDASSSSTLHSHPSPQQSPQAPNIGISKKSRLLDALVFASANYTPN